jgi:DNA-binding MarR family transcriptional regulator
MKTDNDVLMGNLGRAYLLIHRRLNRAMAEQGASLARTKLLLCVERAAGLARAADLAELLDLAPRTVTEALDSLERDGQIQRVPDEADRRVKRLRITPAGSAAIAATEPLRHRLIEQALAPIDAADRHRLTELLQRIAEGMAEDGF